MAPNPITGEGYPEPRVLVEAQGWWREDGLTIPTEVGEHFHLSMWWPRPDQIVRDRLLVHPRIQAHHVDDELHAPLDRMRINWRRYTASGGLTEDGGGLLLDDTGDWLVPLDDHGSGERTFEIELNLSKLGSGTRRIRFNAMAGDDPDRFFVANELPLHIISKTVSAPKWMGKGWYSDHEYQHSILSSPYPSAPVKGTWPVKVSLNPGGGGNPTVRHLVTIDPKMHDGLIGMIVRQGSGPYSGTLSIDTTKLPNGPHKLAVIGHDGQLAAVQAIPFTVAN